MSVLVALLLALLLAPAAWGQTPTPTPCTVNSTLDTACSTPTPSTCDDGSGNCTLRCAIDVSNGGGCTTIDFNIPGGGQQCVALASPVAILTKDNVTVDGSTQPGWAAGNLWHTDGGTPKPTPPVLTACVDGHGVARGIRATGASTTIKGLEVKNFQYGDTWPTPGSTPGTIDNYSILMGGDNSVATGNYAHHAWGGISCGAAGTGCLVGGANPGDGNIVNDLEFAITLFGTSGTASYNFSGVDGTGLVGVPNYNSLEIEGGTGNTADHNLISSGTHPGLAGDPNYGIDINPASTNATISNSLIGLDVLSAPLGCNQILDAGTGTTLTANSLCTFTPTPTATPTVTPVPVPGSCCASAPYFDLSNFGLNSGNFTCADSTNSVGTGLPLPITADVCSTNIAGATGTVWTFVAGGTCADETPPNFDTGDTGGWTSACVAAPTDTPTATNTPTSTNTPTHTPTATSSPTSLGGGVRHYEHRLPPSRR